MQVFLFLLHVGIICDMLSELVKHYLRALRAQYDSFAHQVGVWSPNRQENAPTAADSPAFGPVGGGLDDGNKEIRHGGRGMVPSREKGGR
jgi:hypothetical protein